MSSGKRVVSALWVVGFLQCGCGDSRDPMDGSQEPPAPWVRAPNADGHGDAGSGHPDAGRSKAAGAQRDAGVMATARDAGAPDGSPDAGTVAVAAAPCGAAEDCKDADPCTRNERCDPVHALCQWDMLDNDKDGHVPVSCGGDDFDDANAVAFPGAPDVCDGVDNDADGDVDEEPQASAACADGSACMQGVCLGCSVADRMLIDQELSGLELEVGACAWITSPETCISTLTMRPQRASYSLQCAQCFLRAGECVQGCGLGVAMTCSSNQEVRTCFEQCTPVFEQCTGATVGTLCAP